MPFEGVGTSDLLVAAMKVARDNHRLIANNIANVDTPGYSPVELDFQATLRNAVQGRSGISLRKTHPRHLDAQRLRPDSGAFVGSAKNDQNKVDIDQQIANLTANTGQYTTYGSLLVKQFQMIKTMLANER